MENQLFKAFTYNSPFCSSYNGIGSKYSGSRQKAGMTHLPSMKAILAYVLGKYNDKPFAMGRNGTGTSVEVETSAGKCVVFYNTAEKRVRAGIIKGPACIEPYKITRSGEDGSAILLALMPTLMTDEEFSENLTVIKNACAVEDYGNSHLTIDSIVTEMIANEPTKSGLVVLCDNIKWRIDDVCPLQEARVPPLGTLSDYFPSERIAGLGDFEILQITKTETKREEEDFATSFVLNSERSYSDEEKALIPSLPDWYIVPEYLEDACKMVSAKNLARPVRNIMLRGEAGTGKTEAAKAMAAALHIPYVSLCCHPDMMITDFTGTILPKLESKSNEILFSNGDMPSFKDIEMDPCYSYSLLTGEEKEDVTEDEVIALMLQKAVATSGNGLQYEYCDSPLVKAIKYGWLCEIQEPAIIERPGVLTGLNSLLDTCQQVILPTGEVIKRHPDCVIVVTTNTNYQGCKEINSSVLSRMQFKFDTELPTTEELISRVTKVTGYQDRAKLTEMIKVMNEMHTTCLEHMITDGSVGVRELIDWVQATMVLGDIIKAAKCTIIPSASSDLESQADLWSSCLATHFTEGGI